MRTTPRHGTAYGPVRMQQLALSENLGLYKTLRLENIHKCSPQNRQGFSVIWSFVFSQTQIMRLSDDKKIGSTCIHS